MSETSLLRNAKAAIDRGDKAAARRLLHHVTANYPNSETAWLGLSAVAETPEQEREYLDQVLAINPQNALALKHMAKFNKTTEIPRYESANLMPGEQIVFSAQLTPIIFARPIIVAVAAVLMLLCLIVAYPPEKAQAIGGALLCCKAFFVFWLVIGGLAVIIRIATFYTATFLLTNRRVLAKVGIFSRKSRELLLSRVEGVDVSQDLLGRMFDYGTVIVTGTGGLRTPFPLIRHPLELRDAINRQLSR